MSSLGVYSGAALRFTEGLLAGLDLDRFGLSFELTEQFDVAPGPLTLPIPYLPVEAGLDMSEARYRGLDPHTGQQTSQELAGGRRTISILQGQPLVLGSGLVEPVVARARFDMTLPVRLGWRLRLGTGSTWLVQGKDYVTARLAEGTTLRLSATGPFAFEDGGRTLHLDLPAGLSTAELWIESRPPVHMAPVVVLCTPNQMREAAVAVSCVGSKDGAYVPLLDLNLPPATEQDFQAANARLNEVAQQLGQIEEQMRSAPQQTMESGGLILPGSGSTGRPSSEELARQREKLVQEVDPLQQRVLSYLSWLHRSDSVTRLVQSLTTSPDTPVRLICLAPYPLDLLAEWGETARIHVFLTDTQRSQLKEWQSAVESVLRGRAQITYWKDVEALATAAWRSVHAGQTPSFFAIPDDPAFYPIGLVDALRRGRALLPRGRPSDRIDIAAIQETLNADSGSEHAVIVEADGSVASLVGALYAHHTRSRLYVNHITPQFEQVLSHTQRITEGIQKEQLATMAANAYRYLGEHRKQFMQSQQVSPQLKQMAAGLSLLELPSAVPTPFSDNAFVQALTTYLTAQQAGVTQGYRYADEQWRKDLATLEGQVTVGVADNVLKAVKSVPRLTVFTSGLPYGLVNGWEGKTVGLVLRGQAAPYVLREVAQAAAARPPLTLTMTLDPNVQQRPAPEPPELADRMITLRGTAASFANFVLLGSLLPLDAVVLHTQGSLDTLFFSDQRNRLQEVHTSEISAQMRLTSAPLVIYLGPMAWLSVGSSFLAEGCSGYLGALWPVDGLAAEDVVGFMLSAVVAKGRHPAEALRSLPSQDPRTSRALVYLGTALSRRAAQEDRVAAAPELYAIAARLATSGQQSAAGLVYDRLRLLTGEMAAGNPTLRAELVLLDTDYPTRLHGGRREQPSREVIDKVWQALSIVEKMSLPDDAKKEMQAFIWERTAVLEMAVGGLERAQELALALRDLRRVQGQTAAAVSAGYLLAVVQQHRRQWSEARQILLELQSDLAALGQGVSMVMVATALAYTSLPLAMYPDVQNHLKLAVQASLALGAQVLSETLAQILSVSRVMAQMGAYKELSELGQTLGGVVAKEPTLEPQDRASLGQIFSLIQETADVLRSDLPVQERETRLAQLAERAQSQDLSRSLGMDAWILGASSSQAAPPA